MNPVRVRRVALLLLDHPPVAVPCQGERALVSRHPDPIDGVHLLQQCRKDGLAAMVRRARLPLDEEHRADRDQRRDGENQNRTSPTHRSSLLERRGSSQLSQVSESGFLRGGTRLRRVGSAREARTRKERRVCPVGLRRSLASLLERRGSSQLSQVSESGFLRGGTRLRRVGSAREARTRKERRVCPVGLRRSLASLLERRGSSQLSQVSESGFLRGGTRLRRVGSAREARTRKERRVCPVGLRRSLASLLERPGSSQLSQVSESGFLREGTRLRRVGSAREARTRKERRVCPVGLRRSLASLLERPGSSQLSQVSESGFLREGTRLRRVRSAREARVERGTAHALSV